MRASSVGSYHLGFRTKPSRSSSARICAYFLRRRAFWAFRCATVRIGETLVASSQRGCVLQAAAEHSAHSRSRILLNLSSEVRDFPRVFEIVPLFDVSAGALQHEQSLPKILAPRTVEMPNGTWATFPHGTSDEAIHALWTPSRERLGRGSSSSVSSTTSFFSV